VADTIALLTPEFGNALSNQPAWSGTSSGFITTTVDLPASASGQSIQLKWFLATDSSNGKPGWYIDTVAITNCPSSNCWKHATEPACAKRRGRSANRPN